MKKRVQMQRTRPTRASNPSENHFFTWTALALSRVVVSDRPAPAAPLLIGERTRVRSSLFLMADAAMPPTGSPEPGPADVALQALTMPAWQRAIVVPFADAIGLPYGGAGLTHSSPDCVLIVYRCTRTHSPRPPPWPGHSLPWSLPTLLECRCHCRGLASRFRCGALGRLDRGCPTVGPASHSSLVPLGPGAPFDAGACVVWPRD
jgi:hypothetical protein